MFRKNAPTFFMALIASFLMTAALSLTCLLYTSQSSSPTAQTSRAAGEKSS